MWICEGFWQIFALECALCCCMLIVIGQWTLTLACLAYPGYFGSDPHKGFILQMAHFMPPQKIFYLFVTCVLFFFEQQLGNGGVCKWVKSCRRDPLLELCEEPLATLPASEQTPAVVKTNPASLPASRLLNPTKHSFFTSPSNSRSRTCNVFAFDIRVICTVLRSLLSGL